MNIMIIKKIIFIVYSYYSQGYSQIHFVLQITGETSTEYSLKLVQILLVKITKLWYNHSLKIYLRIKKLTLQKEISKLIF